MPGHGHPVALRARPRRLGFLRALAGVRPCRATARGGFVFRRRRRPGRRSRGNATPNPRREPLRSRGRHARRRAKGRKGSRVEVAKIDAQLRRALALLLRQQFRPGPRHLFKNPGAVYGAMPGSEADWALRIDYVQHAGSAMIRWLEVNDHKAAP